MPLLLDRKRYEDYLTSIALDISIALSLTGLVALKPQLFRFLSFRITLRDVVFAIVFAILGGNASLFLASFYHPAPLRPAAAAGLIIMSPVSPLLEEIGFRGIFFESLSRRYSLVTSILLSSFVFATFHVLFWPAMVGGITLTCVYVMSRRSLSASAVAHITWNLIVCWPVNVLLYTHYVAH